MDPLVAHKTWRTLEPYHSAIYFVPEAVEESRDAGVADPMSAYFASRSAPLGTASAQLVVATFFNFEPSFVHRSMDGVWDATTPERIIAARLRAADRMIRRLVPDFVGSDDVVEAADIARRTAERAAERPEGRPLFAAHSRLPWPDEPHLVLWHAQTLLREFRGDGHIAALTVEGLSGCEALITHAASGAIAADRLRTSRRWPDDAWARAEDRLRARGWLDDVGELTEVGRERREWIERRTDELAAAPYDELGDEACERLRTLVRPVSRTMATVFG